MVASEGARLIGHLLLARPDGSIGQGLTRNSSTSAILDFGFSFAIADKSLHVAEWTFSIPKTPSSISLGTAASIRNKGRAGRIERAERMVSRESTGSLQSRYFSVEQVKGFAGLEIKEVTIHLFRQMPCGVFKEIPSRSVISWQLRE